MLLTLTVSDKTQDAHLHIPFTYNCLENFVSKYSKRLKVILESRGYC